MDICQQQLLPQKVKKNNEVAGEKRGTPSRMPKGDCGPVLPKLEYDSNDETGRSPRCTKKGNRSGTSSKMSVKQTTMAPKSWAFEQKSLYYEREKEYLRNEGAEESGK